MWEIFLEGHILSIGGDALRLDELIGRNIHMDDEYILNHGCPWTLGLALVFILSKHDFGLQSWKSPLTLGYVCKVLVLILMLKMQIIHWNLHAQC